MARRRKHYPSHPEVQTFQEGVECMDARRLLLMFSDTYGNLSPVESYADLAEMAAQHRLSGDGVLTSALKKAQNLGWIERLERGDTATPCSPQSPGWRRRFATTNDGVESKPRPRLTEFTI